MEFAKNDVITYAEFLKYFKNIFLNYFFQIIIYLLKVSHPHVSEVVPIGASRVQVLLFLQTQRVTVSVKEHKRPLNS